MEIRQNLEKNATQIMILLPHYMRAENDKIITLQHEGLLLSLFLVLFYLLTVLVVQLEGYLQFLHDFVIVQVVHVFVVGRTLAADAQTDAIGFRDHQKCIQKSYISSKIHAKIIQNSYISSKVHTEIMHFI